MQMAWRCGVLVTRQVCRTETSLSCLVTNPNRHFNSYVGRWCVDVRVSVQRRVRSGWSGARKCKLGQFSPSSNVSRLFDFRRQESNAENCWQAACGHVSILCWNNLRIT